MQIWPLDGGVQTLLMDERGADIADGWRGADIADGWTGCRYGRWVDGMQTLLMDGRGADIADGWTGCRHCRWVDGVQTC